MKHSLASSPLPIRAMLASAIAVLVISMGVRHAFGLFLPPMSAEFQWGREVFAFGMGLQNLVWGAAQPVTGALGDRYGAHWVLAAGGVLYALGLVGMAFSTTPAMLALTGGVLVGLAHACTTYSVVFGAMGRRISAGRRSSAMGLISAAGSFGQFAMMPVSQQMISGTGWLNTLLVFAALVLLIVPLARGLVEAPHEPAAAGHQTIVQSLREAVGNRSFMLLALGYFVCGFQVVFIGVHLPAYLKDANMPLSIAPTALALIGLFNVAGSYAAGVLGARMPQRYILAAIYLLRSVVITLFLVLPITPASVYVFSAAMGVLWLSTVPPTNSIIAQMFGVRYLSMLSGLAFFSHQIGSFLGVWLGGYLYDRVGSYDPVWMLVVGAGMFGALLHLPIQEGAVQRTAPASAQ